MYVKDKQTLVSKPLFKRMQISLRHKDWNTQRTLDVCAREVLLDFKNHEEIKSLTEEEKEKLQTYLQIGFAEPI